MLKIINENVFSKRVERGIERASAIRHGKFFVEFDEVRVTRNHERADGDPLATTLHRLIEGLIKYLGVESVGILVKSVVLLKDRRWFPIGDHEYLFVDIPGSPASWSPDFVLV